VSDRVRIFDTTLRDGEQAPGINLTPEDKVAIAQQLERLGVDVVEAGFPAASNGEFTCVQMVAGQLRRATVAGLARAVAADVDRASVALRKARHPRLHVFIATSKIHMERKLRMSHAEVLAAVGASVARAREAVPDVEFSAEDASRSDPQFLAEVYATAVQAGATTCNVPDTVGYALPDDFARLIGWLRGEVADEERVIWSVHCHDDLGLAVGCSLAGLLAGARQVETAVNGIGERAGNCALEEIVMTLRTHGPRIGLETVINTTEIGPTAALVSRRTGYPIPRNKAVVGANAFAHESGIHQHGVLADRRTYEHLDAAAIGVAGSRLVLGKHSGRHAFEAAMHRLGHDLGPAQMRRAFTEFKAMADQQGKISDADLMTIASLAQPVRGNAAQGQLATPVSPSDTVT